MKLKILISILTGVTIALTGSSFAQNTKLRIQTHFASETPSGKLAAEYIDNIQVMSGGEIEIEMFYASAVVKSTETFDAAATGILDCDMTGGNYQTGKNSAFQFVGDVMGGYDTPYQQLSWLYYGGGFDAANDLYNKYDMELVGWWIPGQESMSSKTPIRNAGDFKDWKFRSPPGLETQIFDKMGANPIVIDFNEVFTSIESGIIDGADAANLATNESLGIYDLVKHATYPGFHSMPADHLACNKSVWDAMPEKHKRIMKVAMGDLALKIAIATDVRNNEAVPRLKSQGVTLHNWSDEDRAKFRDAAKQAWDDFADTPEAKALVKSHKEWKAKIGL